MCENIGIKGLIRATRWNDTNKQALSVKFRPDPTNRRAVVYVCTATSTSPNIKLHKKRANDAGHLNLRVDTLHGTERRVAGLSVLDCGPSTYVEITKPNAHMKTPWMKMGKHCWLWKRQREEFELPHPVQVHPSYGHVSCTRYCTNPPGVNDHHWHENSATLSRGPVEVTYLYRVGWLT